MILIKEPYCIFFTLFNHLQVSTCIYPHDDQRFEFAHCSDHLLGYNCLLYANRLPGYNRLLYANRLLGYNHLLYANRLLGCNRLLYANRLLGYNLVKSGARLFLFLPLRDAAP